MVEETRARLELDAIAAAAHCPHGHGAVSTRRHQRLAVGEERRRQRHVMQLLEYPEELSYISARLHLEQQQTRTLPLSVDVKRTLSSE